MLLAMAWSTQGGRFSSIFEAINAIASDLAPPITVVFIWGVFWRRGTKEAALTTLVGGFGLGALAFILDLPVFGTVKIITNGWGIPFLMQAWWMFCICSVLYVAMSYATPAPAPELVDGLTWTQPLSIITRGRVTGLSDVRVVAAILIATVCFLYFIFR